MHYVYILFSESISKYYVGQTENIKRRVEEHNDEDSKTFTRTGQPWKVVGLFAVDNRSEAIRFEKFIKSQKSKVFIEKIIQEGFDLTGKLSGMKRIAIA